MLLFRYFPRTLFLFGLFSLLATPTFALEMATPGISLQAGKGKKGDPPPRPRPKPGPRDGGDDD